MRNVKLFVDLSSTDTGLTIWDIETNEIFCYSLKIKEFKNEHDKNNRALLKIRYLDKIFNNITNTLNITEIVMESPFVNKTFLRSSEMILKMHGFLLHKFCDLQFSFITPSEIKKIVSGKGNACKEDIIDSVKGSGFNLDIDEKSNDNIYDSFAVMIAYMDIHEITITADKPLIVKSIKQI